MIIHKRLIITKIYDVVLVVIKYWKYLWWWQVSVNSNFSHVCTSFTIMFVLIVVILEQLFSFCSRSSLATSMTYTAILFVNSRIIFTIHDKAIWKLNLCHRPTSQLGMGREVGRSGGREVGRSGGREVEYCLINITLCLWRSYETVIAHKHVIMFDNYSSTYMFIWWSRASGWINISSISRTSTYIDRVLINDVTICCIIYINNN